MNDDRNAKVPTLPEPTPVEGACRASRRRDAWAAGLLAVAILAIPYLGFLGSHRIWPPFEPELVESAREMRTTGDYLVPRLNGYVYADKPPLYYWGAVAAAAVRGRLDETAARLPSAITLLLLVFMTAAFGARVFGRRAGLLAGLALGTMPLVFQCGTIGMCDMPLALTVVAAQLLVYLAVFEGEPRGWALVLAGLATGVSVMAKSLLGPVLVSLGTVPALVLIRERKLPRLGWWVAGVLAFLAAALPWFIAMGESQGRSFLVTVLVQSTITRFLKSADSKGSVFLYLVTLPLDTLPWSLFLPLAVRHVRRARTEDPERWRTLRFLLIGVGFQLAFLTASSCRINKYVLPFLPHLALCIGAALDKLDEKGRRFVTVPVFGLAVALVLGAAAVPIVVALEFPSLASVAAEGIVLAVPAALALYVIARRLDPAGIALGLTSVLVAVLVFAQSRVYPAIDEIRTDRALEQIILSYVGPETPYASYGFGTRSYIVFYTERTYTEFYSLKEVEEWSAASPPRTGYILTRDDRYAEMRADPRLVSRVEIVGRNPPGVGHDDYVLVRVRPQ